MAKKIPGLKSANQLEEYTHEQLVELLKCKNDPIYFIEKYIWIKHPTKGKVRFKLYDYQKDLIRMYHTNKFVVALSSRQTGKTTTSCAFLLWEAIFTDDHTTLVVSNKSKNAMEIIGHIKYAYEELPSWLKPGVLDTYNKHEVEFDNKTRIVSTTTSKDSGRGLAISRIYADETAFVASHIQEEFWDSIIPTLSTGGSMIITSTPNGDSNLFARTWFSAIAKVPEERTPEDFVPIHIRWDQPPGRDAKFKQAMITKLGQRKWEQEFECLFLSSDQTLFDSYMVTQAEEHAKTYRQEYKVAGHTFYKKLDTSKSYIVGIDPATGSGNDYSVIQVMEFPSMIQVMEYRTNSVSSPVVYTQLKQILSFLEKFTKDVYFSVESNGVGEGIIALYQADESPPVHAHFVSETNSKRLGFHTSASSKIKTGLKMKDLFERRNITFYSPILFHEMKNYVRRDGAYAANPGATDDCISAMLVVFRILEEMASYDDDAYVKLYSVDAEIEMAGQWEYDETDRMGLVEDNGEDDIIMPFLI